MMIDGLRLNAVIGNLGAWAHGSQMSDFLHIIVEAILANDDQFGFARSYIRLPTSMNFNFDDLSDLAQQNMPFMNIFDGNQDIMDFNLTFCRNTIAEQRVFFTLLSLAGSPLRVGIPVPVNVVCKDSIVIKNEPINVSFKNNLDGLSGPTNMTIRFDLELNPDSCIKSLDPYNVHYLERRQYQLLTISFREWLDNCATYFNPICQLY